MQKYFNDLDSRGEADLVRSARQGSHDAFAELLRRSKPRMLRVAIKILKSPEEAEDTLQNACWKAYEHLTTFRQDASFNTWLTSIVVNQARMRIRELRRVRIISMDDRPEDRPGTPPQLAGSALDPEMAYADQELLRALASEIRCLPRHLRQIMLLHVESLAMVDAAAVLGLSLAAAKTRLSRARRELYRRMRRYTEIPAAA